MIMTGIHIDKEKKNGCSFCIWDLSGIGYPFASKYGEMDSMKIFSL